jgi:hypothetical protein
MAPTEFGRIETPLADDQGDPLTEEFVSLFRHRTGSIEFNPRFIAEWLVSQLESVPPPNTHPQERSATFDILMKEGNRRLGAESMRFNYPNGLVHLAVADCIAGLR